MRGQLVDTEPLQLGTGEGIQQAPSDVEGLGQGASLVVLVEVRRLERRVLEKISSLGDEEGSAAPVEQLRAGGDEGLHGTLPLELDTFEHAGVWRDS